MNQLPITTVLPDSFLDEECRCGYNVSSKSKAIWAVEIDLLIHFDEVCKKYNINYCVYAGSLLGAIRHKGFVPWDDDMDVCWIGKIFKNYWMFRNPNSNPHIFSRQLLTTESTLQHMLDLGILKQQELSQIIYLKIITMEST